MQATRGRGNTACRYMTTLAYSLPTTFLWLRAPCGLVGEGGKLEAYREIIQKVNMKFEHV
jgi:hypothetical protein